MPASSKHPPELRERATRLDTEARRDLETRTGGISRIAAQLGVGKEALRNWVRLAEAGQTPAADGTPDAEARLGALEKENRELRSFNEMAESIGGRKDFIVVGIALAVSYSTNQRRDPASE